jgi:beta-ribofuranosylaminobenzene 5'-phosphate synthase
MEEVCPNPPRATGLGPCEAVEVTTTARLHFGFLDPSGRGERPFGSFGLCIDRPTTRLSLGRGRDDKIEGHEADRAAQYLRRLTEVCGLTGPYVLEIAEAIPPHAGLGSGTQLALAVGSALATLEGLTLTPQEIAARLGRGVRSGIGIATFEAGGVVLDCGPGNGGVPQLVCRLPFPAEWRVLLIFDPASTGIHGAGETAAFAELPEFPSSETEALYHRVLHRAFPAIAERDFKTFSAQVGHLQECMGAYFAGIQGGPYVSQGVATALNWLKAKGLTGLGQSSWGPTGFAFVATEAEARLLLAELRGKHERANLRFELAEGRNEGARIKIG